MGDLKQFSIWKYYIQENLKLEEENNKDIFMKKNFLKIQCQNHAEK